MEVVSYVLCKERLGFAGTNELEPFLRLAVPHFVDLTCARPEHIMQAEQITRFAHKQPLLRAKSQTHIVSKASPGTSMSTPRRISCCVLEQTKIEVKIGYICKDVCLQIGI